MDDSSRDMPAAPGDGRVRAADSQPQESAAGATPNPGAASDAGPSPRGAFHTQPMRYPNAYAWLMLFSAMDIMLTWGILHLGGTEVNALANWVIQSYGLNGMIVYKFVLMLFFVVLCEVIGRHKDQTGSTLSRVGVVITAFPVFWSLALLFLHG